jgi:hypothetical protein
MPRWIAWGTMAGAAAMLCGCGYTDLEMAAKQRQIDALVAKVTTLEASAAASCKVDVKPPPRAGSRPVLSSR